MNKKHKRNEASENKDSWRPKLEESFFEVQLDSDGSVSVLECSIVGKPEDVLFLNSVNKTCFPYTPEGKKQAHNVAERVNHALKSKGEYKNRGKASLDGKFLTDGESALIRAVRNLGYMDVCEYGSTQLVVSDEDGNLNAHSDHIAIFSDDDMKLKQKVIFALVQIAQEKELEISNE